ncbi:MAG: hypothetical protein WC762_02025 [Methylobacter sp.]|jgi:hypothetical protein
MSNSWLKEWSHKKVELALRLNNGDCGGSYAEAVIILCSVLSGIAAEVWPGRNQDRNRFVELLVKYTDASFNCQKVSVPLLVGAVRNNGDIQLADKIKRDLMLFSDARVITGDDVDKTIDELKAAYPSIDLTILKKNSYACVLYEEIRSGYVHEYRPGERSDSWAMTAGQSSISYINRVDKPDRLIYFNVEWLAKLIGEVVDTLSKFESMPVFNAYSPWWLGKMSITNRATFARAAAECCNLNCIVKF